MYIKKWTNDTTLHQTKKKNNNNNKHPIVRIENFAISKCHTLKSMKGEKFYFLNLHFTNKKTEAEVHIKTKQNKNMERITLASLCSWIKNASIKKITIRRKKLIKFKKKEGKDQQKKMFSNFFP